jgi:lipopolysaccharide/colanic/teichoic acid biosynthesis glycosyltransferase
VGDGVRRVIDVVGAVTVLVLTAPLLAAAALLVKVTMGGPVVYRQMRTGLGGRLFTLFKLRTMRLATPGADASDEARLTRVGRWLRAASIDELPQLWNVLRGDMALVGPRPLLPEYLGRYSPEQARRHAVKPGLTGLAQVSGRNALSWEEKFAMDVWYVDHRSLWLDLRILLRTAVEIVRRRGISADGHGTMPEFLGSLREAR